MFDSHVHLDFPGIRESLAEHLGRASEVGVAGWMMPSADPVEFDRVLTVAAEDPRIVSAFGVHPWWASSDLDLTATLQRVEDYLRGDAKAVGEVGLDAPLARGDLRTQISFFEAQLALARENSLPLIAHVVKAEAEFLRSLDKVGGLTRGGVVHAFAGDEAFAKELVLRGFSLGVGFGAFRRSREKVQAAIRAVPLERLLIETDAPSQGPAGERPGLPNALPEVARALAELRGLDVQEIERATETAARRLFGV